jgi:hypothetical protein
MADTATTQVLYDGPDTAVLAFTNQSDGTGESAALKVDVSTLQGAPGEVAIERIAFATQGLAVNLLWDADTDVLAWALPENQAGEIDLRSYEARGVRNNAGAGKTGDILFTTVGHAAGDGYAVVLSLRKRFV